MPPRRASNVSGPTNVKCLAGIAMRAGGTLTRLPRITMHGQRLVEERWLERNRSAKAELTPAWGADAVIAVVTCTVSGVSRMVVRRLLCCGASLAIALCGGCQYYALSRGQA